MAKSNAKKKLEHSVRQGKYDPRASRRNWGNVNPIERIKWGKNKDQHIKDFGEADLYLLA